MHNFNELGLRKPITDALSEMGFQQPTEIQGICIPILTEEKVDLIGLAQTGTGKTAAFGLPLLQIIQTEASHTQAIIISPTRELTQQIEQELVQFSRNLQGVRILSVYGGTDIVKQIKSIKRAHPHLIVGTPGRVIDLIKRGVIQLEGVETVVLDEADEMLNMGFKEDVREILSHTPEFRNTWLFSATMAPDIRKIANDFMQEPVEIKVDKKQVVNRNIEHRYSVIDRKDKTKALLRFIDRAEDMYGLVFCRTRRETQALADQLVSKGYLAEALHGEMSQGQRDLVMKKFRNRSINILIATDVAARGIDVDELTHVFHYSLPDDMAYYTHRSGRTARAGKKGISHSFLHPSEGFKIKQIENKLNISFEEDKVPEIDEIRNQRMLNWAQGFLQEIKHMDSKVSKKVLAEIFLQFEDVPKEDIIQILLDKEMKQLSNDGGGNLNTELHSKKGKRGEERNKGKGRKDEKSKGDYTPYYMNVGKVDGVSKTELMDFVRHQAGLRGKDLGKVFMANKHSIVEIRSDIKDFPRYFKEITINDRDLHVRKDRER
jgi:ATP-dependent RNA helicase DeaD